MHLRQKAPLPRTGGELAVPTDASEEAQCKALDGSCASTISTTERQKC